MNVIPFAFEDFQVRVVNGDDGEPWFVAGDVCEILDIKNVSDALLRLDGEDVKMPIGFAGNQRVAPADKLIKESGLYALIFSSRKPEANRFKKWLGSEVLPAIRKTGSYGLTASDQSGARIDQLIGMVHKTLQQNDRLIDALVQTVGKAQPVQLLEAPKVVRHIPSLVGVKAQERRKVLMREMRNGPLVPEEFAEATGLSRERVMADVYDVRLRGAPIKTVQGPEGLYYELTA